MSRGLVLAHITANSVRHKVAFLANGSNLNNVKWVCNDFETRQGAIDRLSRWKGSHCFYREQTAFHSKCGLVQFYFRMCYNRQRNSIVALVSLFLCVLAVCYAFLCVYLCTVQNVWAEPVMYLFCFLGATCPEPSTETSRPLVRMGTEVSSSSFCCLYAIILSNQFIFITLFMRVKCHV